MAIKFVLYGLLGLTIEVIYTGVSSLLRGDWRMAGFTYLWMFPIYGLGVAFEGIYRVIRTYHWLIRGLIWLGLIWSIEYITGWLLREIMGQCPWDYSGSKYSIDGLIRLDMAPEWFGLGLLFERVQLWLNDLLQKLKVIRRIRY